jgi:choline-sulfatase
MATSLPPDTGDTGDTGLIPPDTAARGPNIVVIFPDQWNGAHIGALGHPMVRTPIVDKLFAQSAVFGRCQTNSPLCQPARVSFATERWPWETGVARNSGGYIDPTLPSHVRRMRDEAGYRTAVIGKVHLHNEPGHRSNHVGILEQWGFEESDEIAGAAKTAVGEFSSYTDYLFDNSPLNTGRQNYVDYLTEYLALYQRQEEWEVPSISTCPMRDTDTPDAYIGRTAAEWIRNQPGDRSFYLQVNFTGPHPPWNAPDSMQALYDPYDPALVLPNMVEPGLPHSDLISGLRSEYPIVPDEDQLRKAMVKYYANITTVDVAIGVVVQALRDAGIMGETWIIFASDHGELMGEKNLLTKLVFFHQSIHVPLAIRPPEGTPTWTSNAMVDLFDVAATVLEIGGLGPSAGARGESLLTKVAEGPTSPTAHEHHTELAGQCWHHSMVNTDDYKLVVDDRLGDVVEFYDLTTDPEELVNQVNDPATQSVRDDLQVLLADRLA